MSLNAIKYGRPRKPEITGYALFGEFYLETPAKKRLKARTFFLFPKEIPVDYLPKLEADDDAEEIRQQFREFSGFSGDVPDYKVPASGLSSIGMHLETLRRPEICNRDCVSLCDCKYGSSDKISSCRYLDE